MKNRKKQKQAKFRKWGTFNKCFILGLFFFIFTTTGYTHESRPLYLKIIEQDSFLSFELNIPNTVNGQNMPIIYINEEAINDTQQWIINTSGFRQKWQSPFFEKKLKGSLISIEYPVFNPVLSTIIAITFKDETEQILIIPPNKNEIVIPKDANQMEVRTQYSILGIEHIWTGIDHLLFVFCLLIITGFSRKLLITITGFTIAHSVTLVLSALKIIQLPIPPIEATIALSIVFLCYEIIHHHHDKNSLTYRHPILVASSFGLLHGLGFAAVLGEIGLPNKYSIEALLFFNIGVEIGQIVFIIGLFLVTIIISKMGNRLLSVAIRRQLLFLGLKAAIYFIGIIAAYWMFDRII